MLYRTIINLGNIIDINHVQVRDIRKYNAICFDDIYSYLRSFIFNLNWLDLVGRQASNDVTLHNPTGNRITCKINLMFVCKLQKSQKPRTPELDLPREKTDVASMPMVSTTDGPGEGSRLPSPEVSDQEPGDPKKGDESLKSLSKKFLEGTSAHALPRVLNGSKLRKALWLCIFIGMCAIFIYQVQFLFRRFFSYPITVSIDVTVK